MAFKMKGFSGFGNSPAKYEKDAKEFRKRKSKEDLQAKVNIGPKVDPDAPGTPGTPGYEPPVTSMDYLTKIPTGPRATSVPLSPAKKHAPKGKAEHEDLEITGGSKREKIIDLEDRIEFLNSDISEEESLMKRGKMITQRDKLKNKLKQYRK